MNHREEFGQRNGQKYEVSNRIQPCTKFVDRACLSGDAAIDHIRDATEKICGTESSTQYRKEQQSNTEQNAGGGNDVCDVFLHPVYHPSLVLKTLYRIFLGLATKSGCRSIRNCLL